MSIRKKYFSVFVDYKGYKQYNECGDLMKRQIINTNKVYIKACSSYDSLLLQEIITNMINMIISENGMNIKGKRITIKPNLLSGKTPEACVTTHPAFVEIAASYFLQKGAKVTIADSPGGIYNIAAIKPIYKITGMESAAKTTGAVLNYDMGWQPQNAEGKSLGKFSIINPVAECDILVNLCRLKTHALCEMTAAVKNMFGTIPGLLKAEMHARFTKRNNFATMLNDLCRTVAPSINIVDAIYCMEGNGPAGGTPKKVGAIIGGANPFAVDTLCAEIMGYKNHEVGTLESAAKAGYGFSGVDELDIYGDDYKRFVSDFKRPDGSAGGVLKQLPKILGGKIGKMLEPRPYIIKQKCVGCGECAKCCPVSTIKIIKGKAKIERKKCIKCYCCQELCPKKAVEIK